MKLFAELPAQCDTWEFPNEDGSISTWSAKTTEAGKPFDSLQVRLEARTDNDYGCLVDAVPKDEFVVRTTICGTAPIDDATLDRLTSEVAGRLP